MALYLMDAIQTKFFIVVYKNDDMLFAYLSIFIIEHLGFTPSQHDRH